jgi:hypothetical protein
MLQGMHTGSADTPADVCFALALDDAMIPFSESDTFRNFIKPLTC